jgi:hypothetical protein
MAEIIRLGNGGWASPVGVPRTVTPEQVAASLARLEVQVSHLASAIDRLSDNLERMENRVSPLERIAERAQSAWWTVTKFAGALAGCVGGAVWLLEHGSKLALVMK